MGNSHWVVTSWSGLSATYWPHDWLLLTTIIQYWPWRNLYQSLFSVTCKSFCYTSCTVGQAKNWKQQSQFHSIQKRFACTVIDVVVEWSGHQLLSWSSPWYSCLLYHPYTVPTTNWPHSNCLCRPHTSLINSLAITKLLIPSPFINQDVQCPFDPLNVDAALYKNTRVKRRMFCVPSNDPTTMIVSKNN